MARGKKKPYEKRTDLEKLESNWTKTLGLLQRGEYSVAVVRAAVSLEIALNFVLRKELVDRAKLDPAFVDHLLKWANGADGKFNRLLKPVLVGTDRLKPVQALYKKAKMVNDQRNQVAHGGHFKSKKVGTEVVTSAREAITSLIALYDEDFELEDIRPEDGDA